MCMITFHDVYTTPLSVQVRLVRELEKKFSGKHIVVVAQVRVHSYLQKFLDLQSFL